MIRLVVELSAAGFGIDYRVHAMVAKPLDWCVIQLARRCVKVDAKAPRSRTSVLYLPSSVDEFCGGRVDLPRDWALGASGTFSYSSSVQTRADINNQVYGRFFPVTKRWTDHPTALLLHGWNAELCYRHLFPWLAGRLNRAGFNAAMIELPYHMQRRPREGAVRDFISSDLERMLETTRQAVGDIRALCRWIREQSPRGVGLWGFSLGAWLAGLTVCVDRTIAFSVLTTPIARIDRAIAKLPFCEPVRRSLTERRVDLRPLNLSSHQPQIDRREILLVQSRYDLFAPADSVEELWRVWDRPEMWRLAHGHISVLMSVRAMERTIKWVASRTAGQTA